jgi:hypothetical protein
MMRHRKFSQSVRWLLLASLLIPTAALADDPHFEFIEGLRQRRYFDTALEYIDQLAARTDIPAEDREVLDLQRGLTYRAMGSQSRVPEDREQLLGQAEQFLKKFVDEHGAHQEAAFANSQLGELLFERARTLIWKTESPGSESRKTELQQQARQLIGQATSIYQKAHDLYKQQYEAFPKTFIDEDKEPEKYAARVAAEAQYLRAWFNLARCSYEEGQTFDKGSEERKQTLIKASTQFEEIRTARRTNRIGLQAWLMMGKCFQEQDDINRALGIYNEMLGYTSTDAGVVQLKGIALHYRLICLNHESRQDYQLVIKEADEWLAENRRRALTETGMGILWEKAVAEEAVSRDRALEDQQKQLLLRQALSDAQQVGRFTGAYQEPAMAMTRRLKAELGDKDKEPRDFDTAFERGRGMVNQLQEFREDIQNATSDAEKQTAEQAFSMQLNEIGRMFELALSLRDDSTAANAVAQSRYLLSYVYLRQRKSYDAVIMALYCMKHDREADPDTVLNATEVAIEAAVQAWNDTPGDNREFEADLIRQVCETVIAEYPQSRKGNEARFRLGLVYQELDQPLKAAEVYLQVPDTDIKYGSARIKAGQAYLMSWATTMTAIEQGDHPEHDPQTLAQWKSESKKLLEQGIQISREKLGEDPIPTDEIVAAEVSLAGILNQDGDFAQTIQRLTSGADKSVAKMVETDEERPEVGITSQAFAGQLYRTLLRAYVGTQQIDEALKTMKLLEQVGGQDTTAVYTQLGRELQDELKRLKVAGETERLAQVRQSFEQFLEKVYTQRNKDDYNSLVWIGETYFGLGQGLANDVAAASAYYLKAATAYQEILDNNLAEGNNAAAIKLRLVRCKRHQGLYEQAVQLATELLTENERNLELQLEAAYTLADWGASSDGSPDKLLTSIEGIEDSAGKKTIWGWSGLTRQLQRQKDKPEWETLEASFLEARYELTNSRRRYAATGAADGNKQLQSALAEITIFAQVFGDLEDTWWNRFDRLYQDIQSDLGQSPVPLERPAVIEPAPVQIVEDTAVQDATAETTGGQTAAAAQDEGPSIILIVIALALTAGGGFGFYKLVSKPPKRRRTSFAAGGDSFTPPSAPPAKPGREAARTTRKTATGEQPAAPAAPRKKKRVLTPEEAAARKAAAAGGTGQPRKKKVVRRPEGTQPEGQTKPRKRPPNPPPGTPKSPPG